MEDNIIKLEAQSYKELTALIKKHVKSKTAQQAILNKIYLWSELAIELEQRCNQ